MNTIQLQEVIDSTKKYIKGEWSDEIMAEYGRTFEIRQYMPLMEKLTIISRIMLHHRFDGAIVEEYKVGNLYIYSFFYGLLEGYGMIDCSDDKLITVENYDLLFPIFYPFITSFCKEDYQIFFDMIMNSLNLYNTTAFIDTVDKLDTTSMEKAAEQSKALFEMLKNNPDLVQQLNEISAINDPSMHQLITNIANQDEI